MSSAFASSENETKDSVLARLTAFIPTEIVTAWGAALGVISPKTDKARWVIFAVAVAVLLGLLFIDFALKDKRERTKDQNAKPASFDRKVKTFVIMGAAFSAWALASPGTPLTTDQGRWAFGAALVVSLFAYPLAELWDIVPDDKKPNSP